MRNNNLRLEKKIQREINDIIFNSIRSEDLQKITILEVKLSSNREYAKIYYTPSTAKIATELTKKNKAIKTALSKRLDIYKVPELIFEVDKGAENAARIEEILAQIKKGGKSE